jgi:arsenate reductase (thioredoxin)
MTGKPSVLFVCVHNAGRSQMAARWLRHLAGDRIEVHSAGSEPADQINPAAVQAMREVGIDIADQTPTKLTWDVAHASDVIVAMGCGDACPALPGRRYEDWTLEYSAGKNVEVVRPIRDEIPRRVQHLLAELVSMKLHAMIRPMEDLQLYLPAMRAAPRHESAREWLRANDPFRRDVLALLDAKGPLLSRDIPDTSVVPWPSSGWTDNPQRHADAGDPQRAR